MGRARSAGMGASMSRETGRTDEARLLRALDSGAQQSSLAPPPSALRRATLLLGYGCLIAVNVASGMGKFGPNNAVVSNAYPTAITPSGYAFAIWGIIFMLEAAGVIYLVIPGDAGSVRAKMVSSQCSPMCWHVP